MLRTLDSPRKLTSVECLLTSDPTIFNGLLNGTMQLKMGSAVVSTALVGVPPTSRLQSPGALNGERNLPHQLFGETPNRATGTVALPFSNCIVPVKASHR